MPPFTGVPVLGGGMLPMTLLRPVVDFLFLATVLLSTRWCLFRDSQACHDPSQSELMWATVTRGLWIAWLTHAAGVMDEMLRVFLGIRLTMGLGTPTSVDKVYTKMSRRAEVVAEGIAVDDFPALANLYAGARSTRAQQRASSGEVGDSSAAAEARADRLLVTKVDHVSAIAELWSLTPWSRVRRYDRVHVKGITLRLRQVNGVLNFSFLALRNNLGYGNGENGVRNSNCNSGGSNDETPTAPVGGIDLNGAVHGRGMEELDGIVVEDATEVDDDEDDEEASPVSSEEAIAAAVEYQVVAEEHNHTRRFGVVEEATESPNSPRDSIDTNSTWGGVSAFSTASTSRLGGMLSWTKSGGRNRRISAPWGSSARSVQESPSTGATAGVTDRRLDHHKTKSALTLGAGMSPPPGGVTASRMGRTRRPASVATMGRNHLGAEGFANGARTPTPTLVGPVLGVGIGAVGAGVAAEKPPAENVGNLGVVKILGEAFMRRFNAYAEQVSATFTRVGEIKLIPEVRRAVWGARAAARKKKRAKRFEVREILLEDVWICVDAGVWNDLLGDHVGAAFSPEFRLGVKVGPQELLTENGEGRSAREIGMMLNDKLIRVLTRSVFRETLKTSTLTSMVITSLALDTDARVRQQTKNKSLSPPPLGRDGIESRLTLGRAFSATAAATEGMLAAEAKTVDGKRGPKLWRRSTNLGSSSATVGSDLPRTSSGRRRRAFSPPLAGSLMDAETPGGRVSSGDGNLQEAIVSSAVHDTQQGRRRRPALPKFGGHDPLDDAPVSGAGSAMGGSTGRGAGLPTKRGGGLGVDSTLGGTNGTSGISSEQQERLRRGGVQDSRNTRQSRASKPRRGWRHASEPGPSPALSRSRPRPHQHSPTLPNRENDFEWAVAQGPSIGGTVASSELRRRRRGRSVALTAENDGGHGGRRERDPVEAEDKEWETVAKPPPWMEGVAASAKYDEMKPALDVIKRTVLLAVLQQSNRTFATDGSTYGGSSHSSNGDSSWTDERRALNKAVEQEMQKELSALKQQGKDVDRLVMTALMARVRDTGPNTAFKALASIEISSLIESLAAETRFATYFENGGVDIGHVARSISGRTAGEMVEGVKMTAGKVGAQAQRLRTEALRWRKELLNDNGILPLLSDAGEGNASLASLVESLTDTILPLNHAVNTGPGGPTSGGGGAGFGNNVPGEKDSWRRGVAISTDPVEERRHVEAGKSAGGFGDFEEVDEVGVIMQVLDLLEAVEGLKEGIWMGDSATLGKVEKAVGKVAEGIDVYLILAAGESMLGFVLERLRMLPVGHAKFAGKGLESRVWNLNLEGVHVTREKVDLVMKGFRLPKRGSAVMTPLGRGTVKRYKKRSRCFVINLDWKMGNGKPVKAYLQPNDITVLEGRDGELSEEEDAEVDGCRKGKVAIDHRDIEPVAGSVGDTRRHTSDEAASIEKGGTASESKIGRPRLLSRETSGSTVATTSRTLEKRKGSVLSRIWPRRKSADATPDAESTNESHAHGSDGEAVGGRRGGGGGSRRASAPATSTSSAAPRMWRRTAKATTAFTPSAAPSAASGGDISPEISEVEEVDGGERSGTDGETTHASPSVQKPRKWTADVIEEILSGAGLHSGVSSGCGGSDCGIAGIRRNGSGLVGPAGVDILAAPFLVARVSGIEAELQDVKWLVRQTHFPHLKTAGSLRATVSGLTIELELDTQDLAVSTPWGHRVRARQASRSGHTMSAFDEDEKVGEYGSAKGTAVGGGEYQRDRCKGCAAPASSGRSTLGDTPKGLRLSRLRVSVQTVKVHVSNSALSSLYNLVASAFEAAVKRHVVESVDAAVRKSMNALLAMVNHQVSEKWDLLRSVGGGAGGANAQAASGDRGASSPQRLGVNAVDKVLAASLSHPVVWAPASTAKHPQKSRVGSPTASDSPGTAGAGSSSNSSGVADRKHTRKAGSTTSSHSHKLGGSSSSLSAQSVESSGDGQQARSHGEPGGCGSRHSRASTDSGSAPVDSMSRGTTSHSATTVDDGSGGGGGGLEILKSGSNSPSRVKDKVPKRSLLRRKRFLGSVGRPPSVEKHVGTVQNPPAALGEDFTAVPEAQPITTGNSIDDPPRNGNLSGHDERIVLANRMGMEGAEILSNEVAPAPKAAESKPLPRGLDEWIAFGGGKAADRFENGGGANGVRIYRSGKGLSLHEVSEEMDWEEGLTEEEKAPTSGSVLLRGEWKEEQVSH